MDAEGGHEERDPGKDEEDGLEQVDEVRLDLVALLGGQGRTGDRGHAGGKDRPQPRDQLSLRDVGRAVHEDARDRARSTQELRLADRGRERHVRARAQAVGVAERGDADHTHRHRCGEVHRRRRADVEVAVLGRSAVDHDLGDTTEVAGRARRAAGDQVPRVQLVGGDPVPRGDRRAVTAEELAVGSDDLADRLDRRGRGGDAVDRGDGREERLVDQALLCRQVAGDAGAAADHGVGTGVGVG